MDTNITDTQNPFPSAPEPRSGNIGALSAAVIIVLLVAAGGFYFFYMQQQQQQQQQAQDAQVQEAGEQSSAAQKPDDTSVNSIEADLGATQTAGGEQDVSSLNDAL